jgi:hypothetical protein
MASRASEHFSPRRRTAVILSGEGTQAAYLAGVMRALDAAGVRIDVVLGKGVGGLVAAFSAFSAEEKIYGEGGFLEAVGHEPPYRIASLYRAAILCLGAAFAVFLAPALLGALYVVALPIEAVLRPWRADAAAAAAAPGLLSRVVSAAEPYYFPAVAVPVIVLLAIVAARLLGSMWLGRREGLNAALKRLLTPRVELGPLARMLEGRLWQLVRGTSTDERPKDRRALSEAYVHLLTAGLGQHGFRELVFYALDTDSGREVPFVVLKDRFSRKLAANEERVEGETRGGRAESIDLAGDGAAIFFDALVASQSPPGLVPEVGIKLPRGNEFGGEVHRFASSLTASSSGALADALALGAEQVVYVTAVGREERVNGSIWERLASRSLRVALAGDRLWAAAESEVPLFVIRPESERMTPFEFSGREQPGGEERLTPAALVAQGERDAERLFIRPVLGAELPSEIATESTIPIDRNWQAGPKEL